MYLSVIIPAYNEEKTIKKTISSIYHYLSSNDVEHEILVVVDGAKDNTAEAAQGMTGSVPTLKVINFPENHGKGFVVKAGMLAATGKIRLFTDADNSTSIDHIEKMIPYFEKGFDVVIGSIAIKGHKVAAGSEPTWRRVLGKMGNLFIQVMAVPGIFDTQRGFKLMTAEVAERIFPKMTIDRWGFDVELLALAKKFRYKIKEVPVDWKNNPNSHVGFAAYKEVLLETINIRWNLSTGKYD